MSIVERAGRLAAAAAVCLMAVAGMAMAAGPLPVMEQKVEADAVTLYVMHGGPSVEAQIGTTKTTAWMETDASGTKTLTWVLLDNSSTMASEQERTGRLLEKLFAEKSANERFRLCTFGNGIETIREEARTASDLNKALTEEVEYQDRQTYLLRTLDGLLTEIEGRTGTDFVRILAISDGGDPDPDGRSLAELSTRLARANVPIYSILCGSDSAERRDMASLSRLTHARSWEINSAGPQDVAAILCWEEIPVLVEVAIPEELRDGATRGVQLTFPDGATVDVQVPMPYGDGLQVHPTPVPPDPVVVEKDGVPVGLIVLLAVLFLALIGAGVAIVLILRRRQDQVEPVRGYPTGGGAYGGGPSGGWGPGSGEKTDIMDDGVGGEEGGTQILVGDDGPRMLYLNDLDRPEKQFDASLRERVTIGRSPGNRICLDYERSISGSHCEIYADGPTFRIRDLGSANGTSVDGIRVADAVEISNGCAIQLGRARFRVTIR